MNIKKLVGQFNFLEICGIVFVVFTASVLQFVLHELPCTLCLLQRFGLLAICIGFFMNLRFGPRPSNYAISLLAALFTAAVAMRQILLHILPNSGMYGDAFLHLSLYTWTFIVSVLIIISIAGLLLFGDLFKARGATPKAIKIITTLIFVVLVGLTVLNAISVFMECGLHPCPDNPLHYLY